MELHSRNGPETGRGFIFPLERKIFVMTPKRAPLLARLGPLREKLIDIGLRNRLLNFRDVGSQTLPLLPCDLNLLYRTVVTNEDSLRIEGSPRSKSDEIAEGTVIPKKGAVDFSGDDATRDMRRGVLRSRDSTAKTENRMSGLFRKYQECLDAFGSNLCHLAIGFLEWTDPKRDADARLFAPLILVPVALSRVKVDISEVSECDEPEPKGAVRGAKSKASSRGNAPTTAYQFTLGYDGEDVADNVALRLKLQKLPGGLVLPEFDAEDDTVDVELYFKKVESMIARLPSEAGSDWKVVRGARLAFFSSAKEAMYRDLDPALWPKSGLVEREWVNAALDGRDSDDVEPISDDDITKALHVEPVPTVLETDGSQMRSIVRVLRGHSMVIQGPPGTGKSQTITNLIAATLAKGKSVLFVAEKMAALSVVRERMEEAGLGRYCLELHSAKATPKQVLEQVQKRLSHTPQQSGQAARQAADTQRMNSHRLALESYGSSITTKGGPVEMSFEKAVWEQSKLCDVLEQAECETTSIPSLAMPTGAGYEERDKLIDSLKVANRCIAEGIHIAAAPWRGTCPRHFPSPQTERGLALILSEARDGILMVQKSEKSIALAEKWGKPTAAEWIGVQRSFSPTDAPELPSIICSHVAEDFTRIEQYRRYLAAMKTWRLPVADDARALSEKDTITDAMIEQAKLASQKAANASFARLNVETLESINQTSAQVAWLHESLQRREATLDEIARLVCIERRSDIFADGATMAEYAARLANQTPAVWRAMHSALLQPASGQQIYASKLRALSLLAEREPLQKQVRLESLPTDEAWTALQHELRSTSGGWFNWLPGIRGNKLRKEFRTFFIECPRDESVAIQLVADSILWRKKVADFSDDPDAKTLIGPAFHGLLTDWGTLQTASSTCIDWSQKFGLDSTEALIGAKDALFEKTIRLAELAKRTDSYSGEMLALAAVLFQQDEGTLRQLSVKSLIRDTEAQSESAREITASIGAIELSGTTRRTDVPSLCDAALMLRQQKREVALLVADQKFLGSLHQGFLGTDTSIIESALSWITGIVATRGLPEELKRWILSEAPAQRASEIVNGLQEIVHKIEAWKGTLRQLEETLLIESPDAALSVENLSRTASTILSQIESAIEATSSLAPWYQLRESEREIGSLGGGALWKWCQEQHLESDSVENAAMFAFWEQTIQETIKRHPELKSYHRQKLEGHRDGFRELDKKVVESFKARVDRGIFRNKSDTPAGQRRGSTKDFTQMAMLNHELSKQRAHVPVRRLVRQGGAALKYLMPCWMMGPMAVAQFLEPEQIEFDLLIIDEASQVRPEDALGSLARAKQIVIVGDSKQMPPTDVFQALGVRHGDETVEDEDGELVSTDSPALDLSSVLDLFEKQLPAETLCWHYRSQHQSLIAFSNESFYESQLIIPPSRWHESEELGIKRHFVDGCLQNRQNPAEADEIIRIMREHVLREAFRPEKDRETLGVVAMNSTQQELIAEKWDKARKEDSELETAHEAFATRARIFIRNLENVQGDERDVIIISTTYGKNAAGEMFQRFGPVNKAGGWRRLNVLFTRARMRIHLVTSLLHSDVHIDPLQTESGRNYLQKYLKYAETGHLPDTGVGAVKGTPDSPFEMSVAKCLSGMGFEFHYQVGVQGFFIDIGVVHPNHPGQYLCGIECDGAAYHSHPVARDRDRIRQEILEQRGWDIFRIWSTDWFRNRKAEIERLQTHLARRLDEK